MKYTFNNLHRNYSTYFLSKERGYFCFKGYHDINKEENFQRYAVRGEKIKLVRKKVKLVGKKVKKRD